MNLRSPLLRALPAALAAALALLALPASPASAASCPTVDGAGAVTPAPSAGVDWSGCVLAGAVLTSADLRGASLAGADLSHAILHSARLAGAVLDGADLTGADLSGGDLSNASMSGTVLTAAVLAPAVLYGVRSSALVVGATPPTLPKAYSLHGGALLGPQVSLVGTDLHGLDLSGVSLASARLSGVDLAGADLSGGSLAFASLTGVDLDGSVLSTTTLQRVAATGTTGTPLLPSGWSATQGYLVGPGASLHDAVLTGADLHGRDLQGADLTRAQVSGGSLAGADLGGAALTSTVLVGVDVTGTLLGGAELAAVRGGSLVGSPASLPSGWRLLRGSLLGPSAAVWGADMRHASLAGIDLSGADVRGGTWDGVDLTGADLASASFDHVSMVGAVLSSANLTRAGMRDVDLTQGHLRHALLGWLQLTAVNLTDADLGGATGLSTASLWLTGWSDTVCPDWYLSGKHQLGDCQRPRDTAPPTTSLTAMPAVQTTMSASTTLHVSDGATGTDVVAVQSRVRWRTTGTRARWTAWTVFDESVVDGGTLQVPGSSDSLTCVQVRARDGAGNWSAWGSTRCTTFLTDVISLAWSPQWRSLGFYGWPITPRYGDNAAIVYTAGATLTTHQVRTVRQLGIGVRTCSSCGSVAVYLGSTRVARVSLHSAHTTERLLVFPRFRTARSGVVRVVVTSPGKHMVWIESLLVLGY